MTLAVRWPLIQNQPTNIKKVSLTGYPGSLYFINSIGMKFSKYHTISSPEPKAHHVREKVGHDQESVQSESKAMFFPLSSAIAFMKSLSLKYFYGQSSTFMINI